MPNAGFGAEGAAVTQQAGAGSIHANAWNSPSWRLKSCLQEGSSWRVYFRSIAARPTVLVVPCIATICLIVAAVLGVEMGAQMSSAALQVQVQQLGASTLEAFAHKVRLAFPPLHSIAALVRQDPYWPRNKGLLQKFITDELHQPETLHSLVQVDPNFMGGLQVPAGIAEINIGLNLLIGARLQRTTAVFRNWPSDTVVGPRDYNYGGWGINIKHLIFVDNSVNMSALELPDNPAIPDATGHQRLQLRARKQLWGVCSVNMELSALRNNTDPTFAKLGSYDWKLWQWVGDAFFNESTSRQEIAATTAAELRRPLLLSVTLINGTTWYLDIEPQGGVGWQPAWRLPLLIVLPIACVAVGLLLLSREVMVENLGDMHARSEALLYRMLPPHVVTRLQEGRGVEATSHPEVTILFSDVVGFTEVCARCTPMEVCSMLNHLYLKFDELLDEFPGIYKVETVGDAYVLVANLTQPSESHVDDVISFAIRMHQAAREVHSVCSNFTDIRVGIHTGPVVAGVVGCANPRFCLFGDSVNTASRMESHGLPGKIHISLAAYDRILNKTHFQLQERGNINIKGKGVMRTYLIDGSPAWEQSERGSRSARGVRRSPPPRTPAEIVLVPQDAIGIPRTVPSSSLTQRTATSDSGKAARTSGAGNTDFPTKLPPDAIAPPRSRSLATSLSSGPFSGHSGSELSGGTEPSNADSSNAIISVNSVPFAADSGRMSFGLVSPAAYIRGSAGGHLGSFQVLPTIPAGRPVVADMSATMEKLAEGYGGSSGSLEQDPGNMV